MFLNLIKSIILLGGKMRIPYKTRLLIAIGFISVLLIAGCVDTSINPIPDSIAYSSQMKVVNLVEGAGQATLTLNGQPLGTAAVGGEVPGSGTAFLTVPSGSKVLAASFTSAANNTYQFAATTDRKFRVFLVGDATKNSAVIMTQRYVWQTKDSPEGAALFPDGYSWVAFFNGSQHAVLNSVTIDSTTTTPFTGGLAMGQAKGYMKLNAGSHSFEIAHGDTSLTFKSTVASKGRYTVVFYDSAATLKSKVLVDD